FGGAGAQASLGGYEGGGAAEALGFARRPSSPRKLANEWKALDDRVTELRNAQRAVQDDADRRTTLRSDREAARAAREEVALLARAREAVAAEADVREAEGQLGALDPGVARLHGDERERLDALAKRARDAHAKRDLERARLHEAEADLAATGLPDGGVDEEVVRRLRAEVERLGTVEADRRRAHDELRKAREREERARARLAPNLDEDRLRALDTVHDESLSDFAHRAERLRARRAELDARRRRLGDPVPPDEAVRSFDRETIQDGVAALSRWLQAPNRETDPVASGGRAGLAGGLAAVLAVLFGVALATLHHPAWLAGALLALVLAVAVVRSGRPSTPHEAPSGAAVRQSDYRSTGLPEPEAWQPDSVAEQVSRLLRLAQEREAWEAREREAAEMEREEGEVHAAEDALAQEHAAIEDRLGVQIEVGDAWLPLFVDAVRDWQRARDAAAAAEASANALDEERDRLLAAVHDDLATFGFARSDDGSTATEALRELEDRRERHAEAVRKHDAARRRIEESIDPELEAVRTERRKVLDRLELSDDREDRVDAWLQQLPRYQELTAHLHDRRSVRNDRRATLSDRPELLEASLEELDGLIAEQEALAARDESLAEEIARIDARIDSAKRGHDLSDALAERDAARARLHDAREAARAAAVGAVLAQRTRREATEATRPAVFQRANELLAR
ncbi:MAG: hypothetical protein WD336_10505, partial [Trueperaceae bacterium]